MPQTIHVILNASSGLRGKERLPAILTEVFGQHGFETVIHEVKHGTNIVQLARDLSTQGADTVVAAGGDGTQNAVASALTGTETRMGVMPVGTLNHFARDLKIPIDPTGAAQVIATGQTTRVDMGEVNGRHFINNAIIGLYPVYRFQRERYQRRGLNRWLAIASAWASVLHMNPAMRVNFKDHDDRERRTPFLMVANNSHRMEGYDLGTRDRLDEGLLWVYSLRSMSRFGLFRLGLTLLLGRFSKAVDCEVISARDFVVEGRRKSVGVSLDGEVCRMDYPLHYKCLPQALRVIVPASAS